MARWNSWFKSSFSGGNGACVEVKFVDSPSGPVALVRHSKLPEGAQIEYTKPEWDAFVDAAKNGEFDFPA